MPGICLNLWIFQSIKKNLLQSKIRDLVLNSENSMENDRSIEESRSVKHSF